MHHSLLVSTQIVTIMMEIIKKKDVIIKKDLSLSSSLVAKEDPILCNHCLRTTSNGIRCMGICVADNDY